MKLLWGLAGWASAWSSDDFFARMSMPKNIDGIDDQLTAKQFEFVGNHWTDFSNNYGGCDVTLQNNEQADASPKNRYQMLHPDEECFASKCMNPLRSNRRYKVILESLVVTLIEGIVPFIIPY